MSVSLSKNTVLSREQRDARNRAFMRHPSMNVHARFDRIVSPIRAEVVTAALPHLAFEVQQ